MRIDLKVPFAEKDQAKQLGARWDPARKLWYIDDKLDIDLFARWQPQPHAPHPAAASRRSPAATSAATKSFERGSAYLEQPRHCDCLPWEDCAHCRI